MGLKSFVKKHKNLSRIIYSLYNYLNPKNKLRVKKNNLELKICKLKGLIISINGSNNTIIIEDGVKLKKCKIEINGNNNKLLIGKDCIINNTRFAFEDNDNLLSIGKDTVIFNKTDLSVIEGTKLTIGENCLFAQDIDIRTGDSHGIYNNNGERINLSADIEIGNHVWIGLRTTILKGVTIAPNCMVAACALLNKQYNEPNCIIAGNPAKIVKKDINWTLER